jgi:hypothetical protein
MKHAIFVAISLTLTAGTVSAQAGPGADPRSVGCPAGQAVQSIDLRGRALTCLPVTAPDAALLEAIHDEAQARIAADQQLGASIGAQEAIAGRYAVTGMQTCITGSRGFNEHLQPIVPVAPAPEPGNPVPPPVITTTVSVSQVSYSGFQTFEADGTGTMDMAVQAITHPGHLFGVLGAAGTGTPSMATAVGPFQWSVSPEGRLVVAVGELRGVTLKGGVPGTAIAVTGLPNFVGVLGKDRRMITAAQEDMPVEQQTFTAPSGQVNTQSRVCMRDWLLRKL